jgi:hypothetical protein
MSMRLTYKHTLRNKVDRYSEAEFNGSQIRNVILMIENLATSDIKHSRLMPHHIEELLNIPFEFVGYNRQNAPRIKKAERLLYSICKLNMRTQ